MRFKSFILSVSAVTFFAISTGYADMEEEPLAAKDKLTYEEALAKLIKHVYNSNGYLRHRLKGTDCKSPGGMREVSRCIDKLGRFYRGAMRSMCHFDRKCEREQKQMFRDLKHVVRRNCTGPHTLPKPGKGSCSNAGTREACTKLVSETLKQQYYLKSCKKVFDLPKK